MKSVKTKKKLSESSEEKGQMGENRILEAKGECTKLGGRQYQKRQNLRKMTENRPLGLANGPMSISVDWRSEAVDPQGTVR